MRALLDEHSVGRAIVVCRSPEARRTQDGIEIVPWQDFCSELWSGGLLA